MVALISTASSGISRDHNLYDHKIFESCEEELPKKKKWRNVQRKRTNVEVQSEEEDNHLFDTLTMSVFGVCPYTWVRLAFGFIIMSCMITAIFPGFIKNIENFKVIKIIIIIKICKFNNDLFRCQI